MTTPRAQLEAAGDAYDAQAAALTDTVNQQAAAITVRDRDLADRDARIADLQAQLAAAPKPSGNFLLGITQATPANSGIAGHGYTSTDLEVVTGDKVFRDADIPSSGVIEGYLFKGFVSTVMTTKEPLFRDCEFVGRPFAYRTGTDQPPAQALLQAGGKSRPTHAEFCTFRPVQPSYGLDCAAGSALGTVSRCDLSGGEDLLYYVGYPGQTPWMRVYGNYLHDLTFWNNDPQRASDSPAGWTHNDGLQCTGSVGGEIVGNTIRAFIDRSSGMPDVFLAAHPNGAANSAMMLTISAGAHQGLTVQRNWVSGGIAASIQMPYQAKAWNTSCSWDVSGNRFGTSAHTYTYSGFVEQHFVECGNTLGPKVTDIRGNTFDGSDPATPAALGGKACDTIRVGGGTGTAAQQLLYYRSTTKIPGT